MSSLSDALDAPVDRRKGRMCEFAAWQATLSEEDAAKVRTALARPARDLSAPDLAARITKGGYSISPSTIRTHRAGGCVTCRS